ncbi:hypothetical protein C9374_004616 [Naegleria lovaniensis]|uniref:SHSP domain-containing protein n=1 Tax=Naegleria lovaniensis TaxID=51637 RepID=A0AA88GLR1_NAELO|nr:uncharacterized protein C9374_004616 [Naegleria lovaniensis]KAG2383279.1 hypothetical protein C9374_004616 [Naegleria lovaniensis]
MSTTESTQGSSSRRGQQHKRSAPTGTARRHHNWFDTFFDDPFISRFFPTRFSRGSTGKEITGTDTTALTTPDFIPLTDVSETDTLIRIVCDLPGLSKQDVNIDLDEENRILTLSGEITRDKQEENETFHSLKGSTATLEEVFTYLKKQI